MEIPPRPWDIGTTIGVLPRTGEKHTKGTNAAESSASAQSLRGRTIVARCRCRSTEHEAPSFRSSPKTNQTEAKARTDQLMSTTFQQKVPLERPTSCNNILNVLRQPRYPYLNPFFCLTSLPFPQVHDPPTSPHLQHISFIRRTRRTATKRPNNSQCSNRPSEKSAHSWPCELKGRASLRWGRFENHRTIKWVCSTSSASFGESV